MTPFTHPFLLTDFYKISHVHQYPPGTEYVYSTWIPRTSMIPGVDHVVAFGFQGFIKQYLLDYFQTHFFDRPLEETLAEYTRIIRHTLGISDPPVQHLRDLHDLGYLPILIKAVPEGTLVPLRVPMLTIENTDPRFYWLTNSLESLFSCEVWQASTSATLAYVVRNELNGWALRTTGQTDSVQFQGHDFSLRGMEGIAAAAVSGAGHLLSFVGTDSIPAITYAEHYYHANVETTLIGTSVPASEHSVACSYGHEGEYEYYRRMIEDIYPQGVVSIVSDTWDLWHVLTETLPRLKDSIMARKGTVVIRPDSGDPIDIICGDPTAPVDSPEYKGVAELLWETFGGSVNEQGYRFLDVHIGMIYGDGMNLPRIRAMMDRLTGQGFASTNIILGIGSYMYQLQTRDTFGFALKATHVVIDGIEHNIYKDPVTDKAKIKKSLTGRIAVTLASDTDDGAWRAEPDRLRVVDGLSRRQQQAFAAVDLLTPLFVDGTLVVDDTFNAIRNRVHAHFTA